MLFLLNDRVVELDAPEARVSGRWREIGCGDPRELRALEAVDFVKSKAQSLLDGSVADDEMLKDLAALIVSKTGANSFILKPTPSGMVEARLSNIPDLVLETYRAGAANDRDERQRA